MELIGEEQRIRALFSEVRLADQQAAPSFAAVWNRAQLKTIRPARAFNVSFVAAGALLVCVLVSLAWWSSHRPQSHDAVISNAASSSSQTVQLVKPDNPMSAKVVRQRSGARERALRSAARRHAVLLAAGRKALRDAKAIEGWQSPTAKLLSSPSDELLKSLPQLTRTAEELKSFLRDQLNSQPK